jgi:hypothetical protein
VLRRLLRTLSGLRRAARGSSAAPAPPPSLADPRARDPWMAAVLGALGERYQLGEDKADGAQVLRRTGRTRFNPMLVYLSAAARSVVGFYEVRAHGERAADEARAVLDAKISVALQARGLEAAGDRVEDWGGTVVIRRYQGRVEEPGAAAGAVRFMCQESDQVMDTAAE